MDEELQGKPNEAQRERNSLLESSHRHRAPFPFLCLLPLLRHPGTVAGPAVCTEAGSQMLVLSWGLGKAVVSELECGPDVGVSGASQVDLSRVLGIELCSSEEAYARVLGL